MSHGLADVFRQVYVSLLHQHETLETIKHAGTETLQMPCTGLLPMTNGSGKLLLGSP